MENELFYKRLEELAMRASRRQTPSFTHYMDLSQIQLAMAVSNATHVSLELKGGYPEAERCMGAFYDTEAPQAWEWPIQAVEIGWKAKFGSPQHRDLLGALMGLGFERERIGDVVLDQSRAFVFAEADIAEYIAENLTSAGRITLKCRTVQTIPDLPPPQGYMFRDTVSSMRLDAVLAAGFALSRARAAECIARGSVFLNQALKTRPDAIVDEGDLISLRGEGRVRVEAVEGETRKGRVAVHIFHYGVHKT